jgi:hypothetical protein
METRAANRAATRRCRRIDEPRASLALSEAPSPGFGHQSGSRPLDFEMPAFGEVVVDEGPEQKLVNDRFMLLGRTAYSSASISSCRW